METKYLEVILYVHMNTKIKYFESDNVAVIVDFKLSSQLKTKLQKNQNNKIYNWYNFRLNLLNAP